MKFILNFKLVTTKRALAFKYFCPQKSNFLTVFFAAKATLNWEAESNDYIWK